MNYPTPHNQQYPQQFPTQPAPQYPAPAQHYPQPGYPQAPAYGQHQQPPAQPLAQPLAEGSLDAFYNQPSAASGPSLSWTDASGQPKPIGTTYVGVVARDVTNADVQQQTDYNTKAPLFYKDGRPKFAMKVPLKVQASNEFPDGEASWYVKGQARDELVRAMGEAGVTGSPKAGAVITVTLVQRRNIGRAMNPANVVQVKYDPSGAGAPSPAPAPQGQTQPGPQHNPQQGQPVQQTPPPAYPPSVDQTVQQQGPPPQWAQPQAQAPAQQASVQSYPQQGQPAAQPTQGLQVPPDFDPEQAALLARIAGQNGGQPTQQAS